MTKTLDVKKTIAATVIAASTLGGIAAGATLFAPGFAGAQDGTDEAPADEADDRLAEILQPLVDDGTLSADQLEAVIATLHAARPERGERGYRGHGGIGGAAIAEVLGMEGPELREALHDGQTIADVAAANGVDVQDVVDAIVDAIEERVNRALENDRIDQVKADEILAGAAEHADDLVNGELGRGRFAPRRGPGHGGDAPASDTVDA